MDQIRTLFGQDVINIPAAGNLALAARRSRMQAKKRHDITRVCVEDLLVVCVRRSSNGSLLGGVADILDV
jgi:hypothetical protein